MVEKLRRIFDHDYDCEQRILEIESLDVSQLSLEQQFKVVEEYRKCWDKLNNKY